MEVIVLLSTSDFAGDAIRIQYFGHREAPADERERGEHSRLSPVKSSLFAKQRIS